jgi:endonuclease/exonuclease/phosphatase family metal-dependent hydrolase
MPGHLRIATFNLESLDDGPDLPVPLAARVRILRPQLKRLEADVLCLQEVNGQRPPGGGPRRLLALDRLLAETQYADFHRAKTTRVSGPVAKPGAARGADAVHNLVILSRYPLHGGQELRHDLVAPPRVRLATARPAAQAAEPVEWNRPILLASIALPDGRLLHVVNLHLRAPLAAPVPGQKADAARWYSVAGWAEGFYLATLKRAGQALEARLLIERLFDNEAEALIAVCGDFNAEDRQMPLRILRGDPGDTGNPELAPRALIPLDATLPDSRRYSVIHGGRPAMLDHVLVSRALFSHYRELEVMNEGLEDETIAGGPRSHHAPLAASFDLTSALS